MGRTSKMTGPREMRESVAERGRSTETCKFGSDKEHALEEKVFVRHGLLG